MTSRTARKRTDTWSPASLAFEWLRIRAMRMVRRLRYKVGTIDRITVRARGEWAIFYIDEDHGTFQCQSTYGTYAYIWRSIGNETLKQFLTGLSFQYFMEKTRPGYLRFDHDKTVDRIKSFILETRRADSIDKDTAREAWRDVEDIQSDNSANLFIERMLWSKALEKVYGGDYCEICKEAADSDSKGFWEIIWPKFLEQIR